VRLTVNVIAEGVGSCEGPLLRPDGSLVVTSMSHACVYELTADGPRVLADTGGDPNGLALGADGALYVAQSGSRRPGERSPGGVQRIDPDGTVSWLAQDPIAPNDLCFGPDGLLYLTDPTRKPFRDGRLWRCDVQTGEARLLFSLDWYPNGIGFAAREDELIVADTSGARLVRYRVDGRRLSAPELFAELPYGVPDGFAFDTDGNLVLCAVRLDGEPGEIQVYDPDGALQERHRLGPHSLYTNVALDASGTGFVTVTDAGTVLEIPGLAGPGLPLHPRQSRRDP
jgi:gluconolactonase